MIWLILAGLLYIFITAIICVFFRGASTFDRALEGHENWALSPPGSGKVHESPVTLLYQPRQ
jgi:hypothetical protein